jgi:nitrogen-specific signal transduction histidine kinase
MAHKKISFLIGLTLSTVVFSAPLPDFSFKSPSFNGQGFSSHVLTIENQETTRSKQLADRIQAELDKIKSAEQNSNINKFLNNLESRIYAQISQNLATAMFKDGGSDSGVFTFDTNTNTQIAWEKNRLDGSIKLIVNGPGVNSEIVVPLGQFTF